MGVGACGCVFVPHEWVLVVKLVDVTQSGRVCSLQCFLFTPPLTARPVLPRGLPSSFWGRCCHSRPLLPTVTACLAVQGRYGNTLGQVQSTCTDICAQGYYCPEGSVDPRQLNCGSDAVYCPTGSGVPTPVTRGYYTVGPGYLNRYSQSPCEPGFWCTGGQRFLCNSGFYGDQFGQSDPGV